MNVKQKILIADDSEINRALLMEILGDGYEYLEAENGVRAVELLREHTDIALVLLDIMMPQMDGFDVLKVMRCYSWLDEIPVIMISAAKDTANIERAYDWVWPTTCAAPLSGSWCCARCRTCSCCMPSRSA